MKLIRTTPPSFNPGYELGLQGLHNYEFLSGKLP
jgi:hypothetical protein